ncbi:MAG: hypothetical protein CMD31_12610 [Flavobacteriales bacterium]|uniref:hypothetical protein n=1 Tax=Idiomarina sp. UBA4206 TaxID=1946644 RepID=UPI000C0D64E9|nr:hypothetical protein [Idiomarina sp. UBA4206]MAB20747.1 hypothetical protein [Idiomarina sp.]MBH94380.1 hypothetical protein [Idiomarina sp.]MBQ21590.1 hypothetical protein [Flavobacteriales bacterium]|tara:strand:+ start:8520 stop:9620 length:1101 start_codon:yes stop_codon:yes gene_type:complete
MKKVLLIDTTFPINTRTSRFRSTLSKRYSTSVCAWARGLSLKENSEDLYLYESSVGFGNKFKKLMLLPFFLFFTMKTFVKVKPHIIFASHWDSLICAVFIKVLLGWRTKIVYDCLDMPTSSSYSIRVLQRAIERVNIKFVTLTIFASRHFKPLYSSKVDSYIYENYPSKIILHGGSSDAPNWFSGYDVAEIKKRKSVSWIGVVRYFYVIENILKAIEGTDIFFYVFGDGPDLDKVKRAVSDLGISKQVLFFGRYKAEDLGFIYNVADIVWAAYPTSDFNAIYAISNKYFECSYFSKRPVFSKNTKMAESLKGNGSVILVNENSVPDIRSKLVSSYFNERESFNKYETNRTWEDEESYFLEVLSSKL